jgi:hypothetical protein
MKRFPKNRPQVASVTDREFQEEILHVFAEPLTPFVTTLTAVFKVTRPPASSADIAPLLSAWGQTLPAAYLNFLRESDGAAGGWGDSEQDFLTLWGSGELVERNASVQVCRILPGLLVLGMVGRSNWVAFDRTVSEEPGAWPVVRVASGVSQRADLRRLAPSFQEWRKGGFPLRSGEFLCGGG